MDERIPINESRIRSEDLLVISKDLSQFQDELGTFVNQNSSRSNMLSEASLKFIDFLNLLYQRGNVLQQYARTLIERDQEFQTVQKEFDGELIQIRILNADIPLEKEKLEDLREKNMDLYEQRKKLTMQISKLKEKIKAMTEEHNELADKIDKVQFGITDNLFDDISDTNVNVFLQVQELKEKLTKIGSLINDLRNKIKSNDLSLQEISQNTNQVSSMERIVRKIPKIHSKIITVSKELKLTKEKLKQTRIQYLQHSSHLNQLYSQQEQIYQTIETQQAFIASMPHMDKKVNESQNEIKEIKNSLKEQIKSNSESISKYVEDEKSLSAELIQANNDYEMECQRADLLETQLAEVEILLDDQRREEMKKEKLPDLALIDEQYQKQKVENALLNFSLENATLGLDNDDDLYNQKKRVLSMIDNVNQNISDVNYQIGQIHCQIEQEIMRRNVLDAEEQRISFSNSLYNPNENEHSTVISIKMGKSERKKKIDLLQTEISNLESVVETKRSRSIIRSEKHAKKKQLFEESMQKWSKTFQSNDNFTEIKSGLPDIQSGSPIKSPAFLHQQKRFELLRTYAKSLYDAFKSQSTFWSDAKFPKDEELRTNLIQWGTQVDQVNKKVESSAQNTPTKRKTALLSLSNI